MRLTRRHLVISGAASLLPLRALASDKPIKMRDLYNKDRSYSDLALSLDGQTITVQGFMAPPLKAESQFFVLTKMPMAVCPFCETEAEWPDDILAIYTKRTVDVIPFNVKILTKGTLTLGSFRDEETGFVSRIRLLDAVYFENVS